MTNGYEIVYYRDEANVCPIEEFLKTLPDKDRAKVFAHIQLLKERGFLPFPYTSDVKDAKKLRELRIRFSYRLYRVLYFMHTGQKIVLLHGFCKKSMKLPQGEIELAEKRMDDFIRREKRAREQKKR